ncbi:MAG: type III-B CRISPR module-associated protein Cmr5 [Candidatus Obscuribacterales bacterium]|nr:type III-B CRISPR module-associated protein Cmr5 [Candidatus Obscuribacterales bacterium]
MSKQQVVAQPPTLLKDQQRAIYAYKAVELLPKERLSDYKITVNSLGANILRIGLSAALAAVERLGEKRATLLLGHLAGASISGLESSTAKDFTKVVRNLPTDDYILATREVLRLVSWLKRATQAVSEE